MRIVMLLLVLLPCLTYAQADEQADPWEPFRFFVGEWDGRGEGKPGVSTQEVSVSFILNEKYLRVQGKSVFEPQESNPKGEVHEDLGFISYDGMRKKFVFRQFHVEGFVNQYVLDSVSDDGKTFVFESESIENIPPGWRARVTYKITGENEFSTTFDLAGPEAEFACYMENRMKRKTEESTGIKKITANLMVEDVNATVGFYRDVLGFELAMSIPETGKFDWAMMKSGNAEIMLQSSESIAGENLPFKSMEVGGTLMLYIEIDGVEDLYKRIKDRARMVKELHITFYGAREFAIADNNGYVLVFAEFNEQ